MVDQIARSILNQNLLCGCCYESYVKRGQAEDSKNKNQEEKGVV